MTIRSQFAAVLAVAFVVFGGAMSANAQSLNGCFDGDHNRSAIKVCMYGNSVTITYTLPRPGMWRAGARPGMVLFSGQRFGNRVTGTAYLFRNGCRKAGYGVSGYLGYLEDGFRIRVNGQAPIRVRGGCAVIGYRFNHNSNLVYTAGP